MRSRGQHAQLLARAIAGVYEPAFPQPGEDFLVALQAQALDIGAEQPRFPKGCRLFGAGPPYFSVGMFERPFVPVKAEPGQIFHGGADEFGPGAIRVNVFNAQHHAPALAADAQPGGKKGKGVAKVQPACRAGGETPARRGKRGCV